mmetsp:Transcript_22927/g.50144  ORF Transcript_22927/g.50144 Transcript_22927/m.50144 type:complete len:366 (-) Transcript_22927:150-1247(-)
MTSALHAVLAKLACLALCAAHQHRLTRVNVDISQALPVHKEAQKWAKRLEENYSNPTHATRDVAYVERIVAISYVVTGIAGREMYFSLSLSNLRANGNWSGDIFVLTDDFRCVPDFLAIPVKLPPMPAVLTRDERTRHAKYFKQQLLHLLPLKTEHQYVLYMDSDVYTGTSLPSFLEMAVAQFEARGASLAVYREGTGINGEANHSDLLEPYLQAAENSEQARLLIARQITQHPCMRNYSFFHGGIFLASRRLESRRCLASWGEWYNNTCHRDQPYLSRAVMSGACKLSLLPQDTLGFPTKRNSGQYWTFNHFTRTSRMKGNDGVDLATLKEAGIKLLNLDKHFVNKWWKSGSPFCVGPPPHSAV